MSLHIAFAFDGGYARYAQVAIESVLAHGGLDSETTFWLLLDQDVADSVRQDLIDQIRPRAKPAFLDAGNGHRGLPLSNRAETTYISAAMHLRIFLADLLPPEVDRILYLDVDTLCLSSLRELAELPMDGQPCAAVRDAFTYDFAADEGLPGMADAPALDPADPYFNSGVLLIDPREWRRSEVSRRCVEYLRLFHGALRFPDQDALNYALHGDWLELDQKWNYMCNWELEPGAGGRLSDARIMHTAGPFKLWQPGFPEGVRKSAFAALQDAVEQRFLHSAGRERP